MPTFMPVQRNWFIRYKIYHIPFWMLYNYVMWALYTGSASEAAREQYFSVYWAKCLFYTIFPAFAVYFNLYYLIPRYLQKGRYAAYIAWLFLTVIAAAFLIVPGYFVTAWLAGSNAYKMFNISGTLNGFYQTAKAEPLKSTIAAVTLGMSIKLSKNWIETQRRHQALEKEKLETELMFLKYQFNPHFLFNSINSIFFLIHKNPDMASASLAKFSELLRHQLYESNDSLISLNKEVAYLENFIGLEKLRQSPELKMEFDLDEGHAVTLGIAPFILMTFLENAFKHVSKHKDRTNWISIVLDVKEKQLKMSLANSRADEHSRQAIQYGGIGLKNVQRRLDLLYPGKYLLDIRETEEDFTIDLELELADLPVNHPLEYLVD
jgi:two-component system LytT family sensor kinase